jgi:glucose/mannose-6-phosphate isomerase
MRSLDTTGVLARIDAQPGQLSAAWDLAAALSLPDAWRAARQVILAGVGSAALAADLAVAVVAHECPVPVVVWRDYGLPGWAGPETLVVALSPSGEDEIALNAAQTAWARGAPVLAVANEGALQGLARQHGTPVWSLAGRPPPGAAALSILLLRALARLGLAADRGGEVAAAAAALAEQQLSLRAETPVVRNPAKRMAGQLMDRLPLIFGAGPLAPVARYWKEQINLLAKASAAWDGVPEMDYSSVGGTNFPEALVSKFIVLALRSNLVPERSRWLVDQTRAVYMTAGFNTDAIDGSGPSLLAHALTTLHFGGYAAYYLAVCYGVDPAA